MSKQTTLNDVTRTVTLEAHRTTTPGPEDVIDTGPRVEDYVADGVIPTSDTDNRNDTPTAPTTDNNNNDDDGGRGPDPADYVITTQ